MNSPETLSTVSRISASLASPRAHVFICMIARYVEWRMRGAWVPSTFAKEDPRRAESLRNPEVVPAVKPDGAGRKAGMKKIFASGTSGQARFLFPKPAKAGISISARAAVRASPLLAEETAHPPLPEESALLCPGVAMLKRATSLPLRPSTPPGTASCPEPAPGPEGALVEGSYT